MHRAGTATRALREPERGGAGDEDEKPSRRRVRASVIVTESWSSAAA
jgi:hypothetical protein